MAGFRPEAVTQPGIGDRCRGNLAILLEVLLVLAGLDLIVTGGLGHCPLYARLSYTPASLRRPT